MTSEAPMETDETDETDMKSDEWIRARAKELYCLCSYGDIQVHSDAIISFGDDPGAYVAAWVWVPFEEKQDESEE
jgi:hypothetical protein